MDGPIITRLDDGTIKKHWTIESAEAAAHADHERRAEKIRAMRAPMRANFFAMIWSRLWGAKYFSSLRFYRRAVRPRPERL